MDPCLIDIPTSFNSHHLYVKNRRYTRVAIAIIVSQEAMGKNVWDDDISGCLCVNIWALILHVTQAMEHSLLLLSRQTKRGMEKGIVFSRKGLCIIPITKVVVQKISES